MHLAYLDDSGSDKKSPIVLVGAIVIRDNWIREIEAVCGLVVEELIPREKMETFEEFHAAELFHGHGVFEGISEPKRFNAIEAILHQVGRFKIPCIYSAVRKDALAISAIGSANPVDVAFRMCGLGIEQWLTQNDEHGLALFVFDDTEDKILKRQLKASFRALRPRVLPPQWTLGRIWHIHDDMYFGSSIDSIGIQMADLCNYVIHRKLKHMLDVENFAEIISDYVICSKAEPEWSQHPEIFVEYIR